jgi:hypothetical protein
MRLTPEGSRTARIRSIRAFDEFLIDFVRGWTPVVGGLPAAPGANSLVLDPSDPSTLYAAGAGVSTITFVP